MGIVALNVGPVWSVPRSSSRPTNYKFKEGLPTEDWICEAEPQVPMAATTQELQDRQE
jgi:hypothetical protein